jgi:hypothetical protein
VIEGVLHVDEHRRGQAAVRIVILVTATTATTAAAISATAKARATAAAISATATAASESSVSSISASATILIALNSRRVWFAFQNTKCSRNVDAGIEKAGARLRIP